MRVVINLNNYKIFNYKKIKKKSTKNRNIFCQALSPFFTEDY